MATGLDNILIAESGSTKTDWVLLQGAVTPEISFTSKGLNPYILNREQIRAELVGTPLFKQHANNIAKIFFYGAGCADPLVAEVLSSALHAVFPQADISVHSDITGAAFACCGNSKGIVMILGTGSNACLFDGEKTSYADRSLGYVLGDEASGNWFGRKLLNDFFNHQMPADIADDFIAAFPVSREVVLKHVYRETQPNAYLATYFPFIVEHKAHSYIREMIQFALLSFFKAYLFSIPGYEKYTLHAVGSVACLLEDEIKRMAEQYALQTGAFLNAPIKSLAEQIRVKEYPK